MLTVTFSAAGETDIVFTDHPDKGDFWVEAITWPGFPVRLETAPDSNDLDGTLVLGYTRGSGQMGIEFYVQGSSLSVIRARMLALEAMTYRLGCTVTLEVDDLDPETYEALPSLPLWGDMDPGEVEANMPAGELTLPLNPPAVA